MAARQCKFGFNSINVTLALNIIIFLRWEQVFRKFDDLYCNKISCRLQLIRLIL